MNVYDIFAKISLDTSEYEQGLDDSEKSANSFGSKLKKGLGTAGKVAVGAVAAVGTAAVAAGAALIKSTGNVASYGDHIDKMSQKMGLSTDAYQEWDAILQHSGTSIDSMKTGMKSLASAVETGSDAFQKLGMSQEEVASMSQEELFSATISALQNVTDETERTYLASKLLGKGGTELGALLNTSAEDTEKMRKRVHELGGVMSKDAVKASAAYQDSLQDLQTAFSGVKRGLISDFLPSVTTVMDGLTKIFAGESGGVELMTQGISDVIKKLQESAPKFMEVGKSIVGSLYQALLDNLPQIMRGGTELLVNLVIGITESIPELVTAAVQIVTVIAQTLWENFPRLIEAGKNAITSLTQGMTPDQLIAKGGELINKLLQRLMQALPNLMDTGFKFIGNMAQGLLNNLPSVIQSISKIITNLLQTILQNFPAILQKGVEIVGKLASGLLQAIPTVVSSMASLLADVIKTIAAQLPSFLAKGGEIVRQIAQGIVNLVSNAVTAAGNVISGIKNAFNIDWAGIGKNIINGVISGVKNAGSALITAILGVAKNALQAVKNFFGIKSPSKLMEREVGRNLALGIGEGFDKNMPVRDMVNDVEKAFGAVQDAIPDSLYSDLRVNTSRGGGDSDRLSEIIGLLQNIGVYLDGRTLVGALTTDIDRALGREAVLVGRGVA